MNHKKVIFITGSSSGIGLAIAHFFQRMGWQVVATMRSPSKKHELSGLDGVTLIQLDVTKETEIEAAFKSAVATYGRIDVVVNNAGYGLLGPLEGMTSKQISNQIATNVLGVMNVTRHALPHLRKTKGTVVNIASMLGRMTLPFFSLYAASKWAVEGFGEALAFEAEEQGVQVRNIEPGTIKTQFFHSEQLVAPAKQGVYKKSFKAVTDKINEVGNKGAPAELVAKVVWKAVHSRSRRLRYPVDRTAKLLIGLHSMLPNSVYRSAVRRSLK